MKFKPAIVAVLLTLGLLLAACGEAPRPRADFSVMSSPQVPALAQATPTPPLPTLPAAPAETAPAAPTGPSLFQMAPATVLPPSPTPQPSATPEPTIIPTVVITITATTIATPTTTTAPPPAASPPDEPRRGGSWDMEEGFEVWINPYGDDCAGSKVAAGWKGFTSRGEYGSSCFYLNDYGPNVFSGQYSQLVTFDFVDSHAGLYRTFDSQPGHTYQITARVRHVNTVPPMQFHVGVDLEGGADWESDSVQWTPWGEFKIDEWMTHEATFTASGPKTTIFIKGFHNTASQGGATYIDAVEVIDLG
ncbi:MAG: hypothetical protein ACE5G8_16075 [Anaerolineae bacterium]